MRFSYATSGFPTAASCIDWVPGWDGRVPDTPAVTFAAHCVCLSTRGAVYNATYLRHSPTHSAHIHSRRDAYRPQALL